MGIDRDVFAGSRYRASTDKIVPAGRRGPGGAGDYRPYNPKKPPWSGVLTEPRATSTIRMIRENPGNRGPVLALSDYLHDRGHPVGEIIACEEALRHGPNREAEERLKTLYRIVMDEFTKRFPGWKEVVGTRWENGFLKELYVLKQARLDAVLGNEYAALLESDGLILDFPISSRKSKKLHSILQKHGFDPKRVRGSLETCVPHEEGVSAEEALALAETRDEIIASNRRLAFLVDIDTYFLTLRGPIEDIAPALPCRAGTVFGYEEPGKPFGKTIEYVDTRTNTRYIFPVPGEFVGVKNAILVAEHPDYKLERNGNDRIVIAAKAGLVEKFPARSGEYLLDPIHKIPTKTDRHGDEPVLNPLGRVILEDKQKCHMRRAKKMVGFVVCEYIPPSRRDYGPALDASDRLCLDIPPSERVGVVTETFVGQVATDSSSGSR